MHHNHVAAEIVSTAQGATRLEGRDLPVRGISLLAASPPGLSKLIDRASSAT
jgi:hypothetical protein